MTGHSKRQMCRVCDGTKLTRFLSLGPTPLANAFLRSPDEFIGEQFYPLDVYRCEGCSLVQLLDLIDPETLFSQYIYVTGTSETVGRITAPTPRPSLIYLNYNPEIWLWKWRVMTGAF